MRPNTPPMPPPNYQSSYKNYIIQPDAFDIADTPTKKFGVMLPPSKPKRNIIVDDDNDTDTDEEQEITLDSDSIALYSDIIN
jgi:hypothetical protein